MLFFPRYGAGPDRREGLSNGMGVQQRENCGPLVQDCEIGSLFGCNTARVVNLHFWRKSSDFPNGKSIWT